MALSSTQKTKILRILGYPLGTLDPASVNYRKGVVDRLNYVEGDGQSEVEDLMAKIAAVETRLTEAGGNAGVRRIDDIEFFEDQQRDIRNEKMRLIRELANLLSIPALFSTSGMGNVYC